jgi:beta-glucosidase-like glycosyl hydrolase
MTASLARLVFPSLRPRSGSFAHERPKIDAALAAGVGGFIVFQGDRETVAALTRDLVAQAGRPLLIGSDLERGAAQQFAGLTEMPTPATLGYLNDLDATHAAGVVTATEARAVGVNWNFAPVCDLDVEPKNPIVQTRSFGADPERVAAHVATWVRGCQEHGVLACAKHFPGHGRTTIDSHDALPVVAAEAEVLRASDGRPFEAAVRAGVGSVMTAHVAYPAWGDGRAATFSPQILGYLRDGLGFGGIVVTDALIMGGATAAQGEAPATVAAVAAGCDALLYPRDFAGVVRALDAAVRAEIATARADQALARYEAALAQWGRALADPEMDLAAHGAFADGLADRAVHMVRGERPKLEGPLALAIVDDDVGGPYTVGPRDVFEKAIREAGVAVAARGGTRRGRVVLVYAEPRSWKGRADLGARSLAQLRRLAPGATLVLLFAHPRLGAQIPGRAPIVCCWHGLPLLQRAAARWVGREA